MGQFTTPTGSDTIEMNKKGGVDVLYRNDDGCLLFGVGDSLLLYDSREVYEKTLLIIL